MAATASKMPPAKPAPAATESKAPSEAELRAAFKLRGQRVFDALDTQVRNATNLVKTKRAQPSTAQQEAFQKGLRERANRLLAIADQKPVIDATGIPDN